MTVQILHLLCFAVLVEELDTSVRDPLLHRPRKKKFFDKRKILARDCKQRRPGCIFSQTESSIKPEVIDKEYEAFVSG